MGRVLAEKDEIPSRIDRQVVKTCTATVIASYWGKVTAEAWLDRDCQVTAPVECSACCVDASGAVMADCNCTEWTAECNAAASARTAATAQAWVQTQLEQNTASCEVTAYEKVRKTVREVPIDDPSVRDYQGIANLHCSGQLDWVVCALFVYEISCSALWSVSAVSRKASLAPSCMA